MSLFPRARRPLALVILAVLAIPVLAWPFAGGAAISTRENRALAAAPAWPTTPRAWRALPRAVDAWLADRFPFREGLITAALALDGAVGGKTPIGGGAAVGAAAVTGEDGQMFLVEGLLQSTGRQLDHKRAEAFVRFGCEAGARLTSQGVSVLATMAPSPGEIIPEKTPPWARPARSPTDYDLILAGLARCGVRTIDLRPDLRAAKVRGPVYRKLDTHWTPMGALVAYDRVVAALGRPDWAVPPGSETLVPRAAPGDLPAMAGLPPRDETYLALDPALPAGAVQAPLTGLRLGDQGQAIPPYTIETGRTAPSVLIVGDSFTSQPFFPHLFARFAGRVSWIHMDLCAFDWTVMDRVRPDYVVLIPTEREAYCIANRPPITWGSAP